MIKIMSAQLSNLIAAGEVVEKPSNVIKELVENAIDAHATHIDIYVSKDGISSISVLDNGLGMSLEDAKLSCERHATSKVFQVDDLLQIKTLGFRGEALAAIASVSVIEITTKTSESSGYYLKFVQGKLTETKEAAFNQGTRITVTELFYQTPARFKFLSSSFTHQKQHRDLFHHIALSQPHIAMRFFEDYELFKETTGSNDVPTVFGELFGSLYVSHMTHIEDEVSQTKIHMYVVAPEYHVSHKQLIFTYVNQRYVKYYNMINAIISGYQSYMMVNRYPIVVLYINMDPSRVDVNIHPQKLSVKLTNESLVMYHIEQSIKTLFKTTSRPIIRPLESNMTYDVQSLDLPLYIEESNDIISDQNMPTLEYIGLLSGTYALFQNATGLFMMDIHAAAERVRFAYYQTLMVEKMSQLRTRLIPHHIQVEKDVFQTYLTHQSLFKSYGFELSREGVVVHPEPILESEIDMALDYIYQQHLLGKTIEISQLKDALTKDVSCKGAIKANTFVSKQEILALLKQLQSVDNPYQCPHGRPTLITLSHYDIEKMFKRVVS
jgi:DNA mismatch repair protein MutL